MISAVNLSKSYGSRLLFEKANFSLTAGEHLGLVGQNGHGKSTLFRIISGEESADEGQIVCPKNYRIGFLKQNTVLAASNILQEACLGLPKAKQDEQWLAQKALSGLGFKDSDFARSPQEFSSGYQMRIALAKLLLSEPNLLLLDEPSNFLDILSIRWLAQFLKSWPSELILISHDRSFMDFVSQQTMGIHRKRLRKIEGNSQKYYQQIAQEEEVHERERLKNEKVRKKEQEFIDKFRAKARRASQAQSRLKRLEKMSVIDKLDHQSTLNFSFHYENIPAKTLIEAEKMHFAYRKEQPIVEEFTFSVPHGEKIAIIGRNGAGKSTLMRLLKGDLALDQGRIQKHPQCQMAYFSQEQSEKLGEQSTVLEEIEHCLPLGQSKEARGICAQMMFSGDDALKKVSVLSGGEKCRVLLGKVLASSCNLLLLDEPTHHLDIPSCAALSEAVKKFPGSVLLVTHDERFLRDVASQLIVFDQGGIEHYLGGYDDFLRDRGWKDEDGPENDARAAKSQSKKEQRRQRAEQLRRSQAVLKPLKLQVERLETRISEQEAEHAQVQEQLLIASQNQDTEAILQLSQRHKQLEIEIEQGYEELLEASEAYEQAQKN